VTNSTDGSTQEPIYIPAKHAGDGTVYSLKSHDAVSSDSSQPDLVQPDLVEGNASKGFEQVDFQSPPFRETDFSSDHIEVISERPKTNVEPTQESFADLRDPSFPAESDRTVVNASPIAEAQEFYPTGSVASLARVLVGQQLDHYHLHELVGGGGMGAVFKASDTRLDRIVAVKVIPNLGRDQESLKRFRVEAQSAAKLDHPNIARVYYVGETPAWSYIVFEFVEGVNLRDLVIRNDSVSIDDSIYYTIQIALALQHASERGIVHRDIKPSNALVTSSDVVKVVDMGLARTTSLDQSTNDLTASGVTLGTFDYISPEQARDPRAADVRSDLYSLGCTLYYLLTGRPPYYQGTAIQKLLMHGETPPEDPRHFRDDIPGELLTVIRKLMSKRPRDRYQQPVDLIFDLQSIAKVYDLPKSKMGSNSTVISPVSSSRWLQETFPWLVSLLFLLASSAYLYRQHLDSSDFAIPQEVITETPPVGESSKRTADSVLMNSVLLNAPSTADNRKPPAIDTEKIATIIDEAKTFQASVIDEPNLATNFIEEPNELTVSPRSEGPPTTSGERWSFGVGPKTLVPDATYSTSDRRLIGLSANAEDFNRADPKLNMIGTQPASIKVVMAPPNIVVVRQNASPQHPTESFSSIIDPPIYATLSEAIELANANLEIDEIWLDEDQIVLAKSIKVTSPRLLVRSKSGRRCRIEWKPEASPPIDPASRASSRSTIYDNNEVTPRIAMLDLNNSNLFIQDVDIQVSSPETGQGRLAFAALAGGSQLRLSNSIVTLLPHNSDWNVAFAFVGSKPFSDPPQIELENAIVRGTGSLIEMEVGTRSELRWSNGLLALDGWLLETNGGALASKTPQTIRMDLQDLTIDTRLGLARVNLTPNEPYPLCISRDAKNCTFMCSPNSPLISIEGVSWNDTSELNAILPSWIDLRGSDNAYDEQVNTIIRLQGMSGRIKQIGFEASSLGIFSERAPETTVRWSNTFDPNKPFDQRTPNDYLQETSTSFRSGMRTDALPRL